VGAADSLPHNEDTNSAGCLIDYIIDLDSFAFGRDSKCCPIGAGNRSCVRFAFRGLRAELLNEVLKLYPRSARGRRPLASCGQQNARRASGNRRI
jgi:hypothetical protein